MSYPYEDVKANFTFTKESDDPKYQLIKSGENGFSFNDNEESHRKDFSITSLCESCIGDHAIRNGIMEAVGYHAHFINDANVLMRNL